MVEFLAFAMFITVGGAWLIARPVMTHPTLPRRARWTITAAIFVLLVPVGLVLYAWLGVPQMAAN